MANDLDIRASDAERERVATLLRDHAAEGRLDADELGQRLECAYAARTRGELERLTADLPALSPRRPPAPRRPPLRPQVATYLAVIALLVAIWAVSGGGHFWPMWPALGWGIALATGKGATHCHPRRPRAAE